MGIVRIGRYNIVTKEVNKVSFRGIMISIGNRGYLRYNELIGYEFRRRLTL